MRRIEYTKKKDKKAQIKFIKDETIVKDGEYKSHTVHVPSGEPPSSTSRPAARRKPGIVRPITQGKLLRAGGPSNVSFVLRCDFRLSRSVVSRRQGFPGQSQQPNQCQENRYPLLPPSQHLDQPPDQHLHLLLVIQFRHLRHRHPESPT
jgi:hypothetical protein